MKNWLLPAVLLCFCNVSKAQETLGNLTIEKIMKDPRWMGTQPSSPRWSADGSKLYFNWNPEQDIADSLYYITLSSFTPVKAGLEEKKSLITADDLTWNNAHTAYVYSKDGDIFFTDTKTKHTKRITHTRAWESSPLFSFNESMIVYTADDALYAWNITTGETTQLCDVQKRNNEEDKDSTEEEKWLHKDQLLIFDVLRSRKDKKDKAAAYTEAEGEDSSIRNIDLKGKTLFGLQISPDGNYICYRLYKRGTGKRTIVPAYVTESGYVQDIPGRTKVGEPQGASSFFLYDRKRDTLIAFSADSLPGINEQPDYTKYYAADSSAMKSTRAVSVVYCVWSPDSRYAILDIHSDDNKDRWLMCWNAGNNTMKLVDRQRDEAWIDGPGIWDQPGWINNTTCYFQSEKTGYSHLYTADVTTNTQRALTAGKYEIQKAQLSLDKKYFYIITNQVHPGEQQLYRLSVADGKQVRITTMSGGNDVTISPDEKNFAILYSYSNKPWELFLQANDLFTKKAAPAVQITNKAESALFKSYPWRAPDIVTFTARDGDTVYARLYKPNNPHPGMPAVLFVHGAGYLQDAHKYWSYYFREFMFNNMLADEGYYVIDVDYRGSAGYGRDCRTGIYRHMGGKDLDDNVDAVKYLVNTYGVDAKRIGMYGGSYGGFMSLMAMFTQPGVYACAAALRPVTDWANYNHGYTSNILNEPQTDSIAYKQSSPIYFANGLQGRLLICHGMVDENVHYVDAVKLAQRLIELHKENWELASYPMEDHGFVEPSSWTDEYKRIYKMFTETLKK